VCSGTTSKQIASEKHIRAVGYGGMLAEAFVALIAMVTVMIVAQKDLDLAKLKPGTIYGNGIGDFLTLIIGEKYRNFAITFGAMAFSTFVFDTVDVSTRLGRYIVQELFRWTSRLGALVGTLLTVALPMYFILFAPPGSWVRFWTLFGASNQLLAALTLLAITVWLHQRRQKIAFTLWPMLFVLVTTLYALVRLTWQNFSGSKLDAVAMVNGMTSAALILLALYLVFRAIVRVRNERVLGAPLAGNACHVEDAETQSTAPAPQESAARPRLPDPRWRGHGPPHRHRHRGRAEAPQEAVAEGAAVVTSRSCGSSPAVPRSPDRPARARRSGRAPR
jgi:carbon starvation protein